VVENACVVFENGCGCLKTGVWWLKTYVVVETRVGGRKTRMDGRKPCGVVENTFSGVVRAVVTGARLRLEPRSTSSPLLLLVSAAV